MYKNHTSFTSATSMYVLVRTRTTAAFQRTGARLVSDLLTLLSTIDNKIKFS